ncbi:MAG: GNAT family N-acetyltransferase [Rickettsiales bacterium]
MMIRPATFNDADAIAAVHIASWHETYGGIVPDSYLQKLDVKERKLMWEKALEKGQLVYVAEVDGKVVGFANGGNNRDNDDTYPGELYAIYLLKAFHQRGLGKKLFEQVVSQLSSDCLLPFVTYVLADNPTLGFYMHSGARIIGEHMEDFGEGKLRELRLAWG